LIVGVYAYANQVTITYSGTITSANDISGYFGNVTTAMNGKAFTLAFTMDDTQGAQYLGTWPTCNNGLQNSGTSNSVPKPVLSITSGTRPYTFGGLAWNSYSSFTSSSNGTSPKTKLFNKLARYSREAQRGCQAPRAVLPSLTCRTQTHAGLGTAPGSIA